MLDNLKDNSLKAAGYAYLVGDAALFASGAMSGRYKEASSGLLWGLGGLACARYGNPDAEGQLRLLSVRLAEYLHRQGVAIPHTTDTQLLTRHEGIIDRIETFLFRYPSQALNTVYAVGGVQLMRSGIQHKKKYDTASGALITSGALAGLLIPEKQPDLLNPADGLLGKAWEEVQRKPLRVPGALFALNNVTMVISAFKEMKSNPAQKSYLFKFLTAASYIFGNAMLMLSSKANDRSDQNTPPLEKLEDVSARVIAAQAPELREALVQQIAAYLSDQPQVKLKADEIAGKLHDRLAQITVQPLATGTWQNKVNLPATPGAPSV